MPLSAVLAGIPDRRPACLGILIEHADEDTRDSLLRSAADIWAVSGDLAEAAAEGYRIASAARARHDSQLRSALLNGLLDGRLGDGSRLWESSALLKLPQHGRSSSWPRSVRPRARKHCRTSRICCDATT